MLAFKTTVACTREIEAIPVEASVSLAELGERNIRASALRDLRPEAV